MIRERFDHGVFTLSDVLSPEECKDFIARAETAGFEAATIITADGPTLRSDVRNNDRSIIDDAELAASIWSRVQPQMPVTLLGREVRGLNERFRFYRYEPGQKFSWHQDGPFRRENGECSLLTFMIYLNESYQGGDTRFEWMSVKGCQGMALVFGHGLLHEGGELVDGVKYVLRSDVMYGPVGEFAPLSCIPR